MAGAVSTVLFDARFAHALLHPQVRPESAVEQLYASLTENRRKQSACRLITKTVDISVRTGTLPIRRSAMTYLPSSRKR